MTQAPDAAHETLMFREAAEAPDAARRQLERCAPLLADLGRRLRALKPRVVVTCARGSSDHAATYGKYLVETRLGVPVASVGPSVVSLYRSPLSLEGALFVAVSQSGRSPDLLRLSEMAKAAGALVVGIVNDETAPLADRCDAVLPLCAGPERSVAATKSYLTSALAFLNLAAHWADDGAAQAAAAEAPRWLEAAKGCDWGPALSGLKETRGLYVVGRGLGAGAAMEMALKFKETCRLHAEAFSAAEVMHGPLELVGPGFPVLALTQDDATLAPTRETVARLVALGSPVMTTDVGVEGAARLPVPEGVPAELAPLAAVQAFYGALPALSLARGLDPDRPANLRKVTETV
ncbi:MAG TPA: SIS domain-containing protein [Azospirillaceae bacterium]|nr:SIS domain-containing protein [Azospirillaceae bacterium]